jgi:hypothetical protein
MTQPTQTSPAQLTVSLVLSQPKSEHPSPYTHITHLLPPPSLSHMFLINHYLDVEISPSWNQATSTVPRAFDDAGHVASKAEGQTEDSFSEVLLPDYFDANTTNGVPSILANSNRCAAFSGGKATSFVMLDFVDIGKGLEAVDILNAFSQ